MRSRTRDAAERERRLAHGVGQWLDHRVAEAERARAASFRPATDTVATYLQSVEPRRDCLRELLGLDRCPPRRGRPATRTVFGRRGPVLFEDVTWEPWPGLTLDAVYARPDDTPRPLVLVAHQLSGSPEQCFGIGGDGPLAETCQRLLDAGLAVLAPRLLRGWQTRLSAARKARVIGLEWLGAECAAVLRLLDEAVAWPEVDPGALGAFGFSRGGQLAMLLGALDERLAATAVASWYCHRTARLLDDNDARLASYLSSPEDEQFIPGWVAEFSDASLGALLAPEPLLLTSGLDDPVLPYEHVEAAAEPLRGIYQALGFGELFQVELFGGGHEPAPEATTAFFVRWLEPPAPPVAPVGRPLKVDRPRPRLTPAMVARRRRGRRRR